MGTSWQLPLLPVLPALLILTWWFLPGSRWEVSSWCCFHLDISADIVRTFVLYLKCLSEFLAPLFNIFFYCGHTLSSYRIWIEIVLSVKSSTINYMHSVVQASPPSISETLLSPHIDTVWSLKSCTSWSSPPHPELQVPGKLSSVHSVYEFANLKYFISVESYNICSFGCGLKIWKVPQICMTS